MPTIVADFRKYFTAYYQNLKISGSFSQNIAITFSGNIAAQILGILFTPLLARLYGPEAYGIFALLMAVVNNLSQVSTLQLQTGFVAANNNDELFGLIKISLIALFLFSGLSALIIFTFKLSLAAFFNVHALLPFSYWIPIYVILIGIDNILLGWTIQLKEFKRSAVGKAASVVVGRGVSLIIGLAYMPNAFGIIFGNLLSYPIESISKWSKSISKIRFGDVYRAKLWIKGEFILKRYTEYIFFVTPGVFISNLSNLLPIYYFSIAYSQKEVGYFAMASSVISMPLTLIVNSSITVFLQKAAETIKQSREDLARLVLSLHRKLFFFGLVPLILIALFSKWIFFFIFGPEWEQAGVYASFLCVAYSFNVVHGPLSVLFRLLNNEKINFITMIIFFGLKLIGLWIGVLYESIIVSLAGFMVATLLSQLASILIIFHLVKLSKWFLAWNAAIVFLFAFLIMYLNL